jgi:hypothetical protein
VGGCRLTKLVSDLGLGFFELRLIREYLQSAGSFARGCAKRAFLLAFSIPWAASLESHAVKKHVWEQVLQSCNWRNPLEWDRLSLVAGETPWVASRRLHHSFIEV